MIEGDYQLNILVQNSVGKEFSVVERSISIPEKSGPAEIIGPVLGYNLQEHPTPLHVPFRMMDKKLAVDPNNTFSSTEDVVVFFNIMNITKELWQEGNKIYNSDIRLLNSLGFCYYKSQQKEKALEVLKASLRLNPEQKDIKKIIEEIEKK